MKSISSKIRLEVWRRAEGHCRFAGLSRFLLGDALFGRRSLKKAHIVAEGPNGMRGDTVLSPQLVDEPANLMLSARRRTTVPVPWGVRLSKI